jgi:hypothetical protein
MVSFKDVPKFRAKTNCHPVQTREEKMERLCALALLSPVAGGAETRERALPMPTSQRKERPRALWVAFGKRAAADSTYRFFFILAVADSHAMPLRSIPVHQLNK